jgi:hypothetical protein
MHAICMSLPPTRSPADKVIAQFRSTDKGHYNLVSSASAQIPPAQRSFLPNGPKLWTLLCSDTPNHSDEFPLTKSVWLCCISLPHHAPFAVVAGTALTGIVTIAFRQRKCSAFFQEFSVSCLRLSMSIERQCMKLEDSQRSLLYFVSLVKEDFCFLLSLQYVTQLHLFPCLHLGRCAIPSVVGLLVVISAVSVLNLVRICEYALLNVSRGDFYRGVLHGGNSKRD